LKSSQQSQSIESCCGKGIHVDAWALHYHLIYISATGHPIQFMCGRVFGIKCHYLQLEKIQDIQRVIRLVTI